VVQQGRRARAAVRRPCWNPEEEDLSRINKGLKLMGKLNAAVLHVPIRDKPAAQDVQHGTEQCRRAP
jgi:hypothetical protein